MIARSREPKKYVDDSHLSLYVPRHAESSHLRASRPRDKAGADACRRDRWPQPIGAHQQDRHRLAQDKKSRKMRDEQVIIDAKTFAETHGYPKEVFQAFLRQYLRSVKRGIAWEFTLQEWWEWWQQDDRWANRGSGRDEFVMARFADEGPYNRTNTYCATGRQNGMDTAGTKGRIAATKARRATMTKSFVSVAKRRMMVSLLPVQQNWLKQQADSFGISVSEMLRRIIDELRKPKN